MKILLLILIVSILNACGGGGDQYEEAKHFCWDRGLDHYRHERCWDKSVSPSEVIHIEKIKYLESKNGRRL